tara:strand:- start:2169 stop:2984 length:816 start_codon:yes stop_codon:yes gene_type:complete
MNYILELKNVSKIFYSGPLWDRKNNHAVNDISLTLGNKSSQILGIVGESGSGKSTLALLTLGFLSPTKGQINLNNKNIQKLNNEEMREYTRVIQPVYQDPFASFNPFYKINRVLEFPLKKYNYLDSKTDIDQEISDILEKVGLDPKDTLNKYPHQLSGGERQRLMIARALLCKPKFILADEPVSMVDASLRSSILSELKSLSKENNIHILYITHDLTTAYNICDDIMVMKNGMCVEHGECKKIINNPKDKYTKELISSIPTLDTKQNWINK